uniref:Uncharacterized protein n=1 Tax=Cacopsylla melanoneura TaxID=428564 RepID=A0A8D8TJF3_9HEMI
MTFDVCGDFTRPFTSYLVFIVYFNEIQKCDVAISPPFLYLCGSLTCKICLCVVNHWGLSILPFIYNLRGSLTCCLCDRVGKKHLIKKNIVFKTPFKTFCFV